MPAIAAFQTPYQGMEIKRLVNETDTQTPWKGLALDATHWRHVSPP